MIRIFNPEQMKEYEERGYFVIKGLFSSSDMRALKTVYKNMWVSRLQQGGIRQDPEYPMESLFPTFHEMHRVNEEIKSFILRSENFQVAKELLGHDALVIGSTCFFKAPNTKALPFHQDDIDNGASSGRTCAFWISLDDTSMENGSLCFIPRSHHLGLLAIKEPARSKHGLLSIDVPDIQGDRELPEDFEIAHIETKSGDVVVFDGQLVHGSTANRTVDRFRRSLAVHFVREDTEKVFGNFYHLMNKHGDVVSKPVNKKHSILRHTLLDAGENKQKIY